MAFDFSSVIAPFRMQPGLRRLPADAPQFTPSRPGDEVLRAKLAVLTQSPHDALLAAPGFDPGLLWQRVARRAADEHADSFRIDADGTCTAIVLGWSVRAGEVRGRGDEAIGSCLRALPADLRLAGLLALAFAEDVAVLDGVTGRVPCLAVCLPSRWVPADKVGRHFAEIHAPVADGAALVAAAGPLLRLLVGGGVRWERFVWTVSASPQFDGHPDRVVPPAWEASAGPDALARAAHFRTERQTFGALIAERQALFTIQVDVRPLTSAVRAAADAARLHDALGSMSSAVLAYRGLTTAREPLLRWLDSVRAG